MSVLTGVERRQGAHTQRRPGEDRGRDRSDEVTAQECWDHQKPEEARKEHFLALLFFGTRMKNGLENFEHYFASMCNCVVV